MMIYSIVAFGEGDVASRWEEALFKLLGFVCSCSLHKKRENASDEDAIYRRYWTVRKHHISGLPGYKYPAVYL